MRSAAVFACVLTAVHANPDADCQAQVYPKEWGAVAPYNGVANVCPDGEPAVLTEAAGGTFLATAATASLSLTACCHAAAKCSTTYAAPGTGGTLTDCPTNTVLQGDEKCFTVATDASAKCGAQLSTHDVDIDKAHCCRLKCSAGWELNGGSTNGYQQCDAGDYEVSTTAVCAKSTCAASDKATCCVKKCSAGFELNGGSTNGYQQCDAGDFQVSTTATCAKSTCAASDKATCCQKKCSTGVVLNGVVPASPQDVACASDKTDKISTTLFCTKSTCTTSDTACCLNKCSDGFEAFGGETADYKQCAEGLIVSADNYCTGPTCASTDSEQCCLTKCDAAKGFELDTTSKTDGKSQCKKDLRVNPTGNCKATSCSASSSVCCQQKCSAGFKVKGAKGTGTECAEHLTVHATAYCKGSSCGSTDAGVCCQAKCSKGWKLNGATTDEANTCPKETTLATDGKCAGSPCAATDDKLCCNEKCTDAKKGFKVKGGTGKEANECAEGEIVSSKSTCSGDCSSDDASTCCLKANNTTATTDAHGFGLATVVGMLVVLSAAS